MTRARVSLLGLATAGTTGAVLLARSFMRALQEIDVEISLHRYGQQPHQQQRPAPHLG